MENSQQPGGEAMSSRVLNRAKMFWSRLTSWHIIMIAIVSSYFIWTIVDIIEFYNIQSRTIPPELNTPEFIDAFAGMKQSEASGFVINFLNHFSEFVYLLISLGFGIVPYVWYLVDTESPNQSSRIASGIKLFGNLSSETRQLILAGLLYFGSTISLFAFKLVFSMIMMNFISLVNTGTLFGTELGAITVAIFSEIPSNICTAFVVSLVSYFAKRTRGGHAFFISITVLLIVVISIYIFLNWVYIECIPLEQNVSAGLYNGIKQLANRVGFPIEKICYSSSPLVNAYCFGFGIFKGIRIQQGILEFLSEPEILGVLGHELGHYYHMDSLQAVILIGIKLICQAIAARYFMRFPSILKGLGFREHPPLPARFLMFYLTLPLTTMMLAPVDNGISWIKEFRADTFAKKLGYATDLSSSFVKMAGESPKYATSHYLYALFNYSHPTIVMRLRRLMS